MSHRGHAAEAGAGLRIVALGGRARRALERSGGAAHPLSAFPESPWFEAAREIIWVGARLPALHPRAVMTATPPVRGRALQFESIPRSAWSPRLPKLDRIQRAGFDSASRRLQQRLGDFGAAGGFGALLVGANPEFPLDRAIPLVRAIGRAFNEDDPKAAIAA